MVTKVHYLPTGLPPPLDLRRPPSQPSQARGYDELLLLLEELGARLDRGSVPMAELLEWERRVFPHLREAEIDMLISLPEEEDFNIRALPERRWRSLKRILLNRKGIAA